MNTLSQQQYVRAQKQRKQELYKNMLDQQVRLKEGRRQREIQHLKHPFSDARYPNQQRNNSPYSPEQNKYLPPLNYQQSRREEDIDKTQIYLNNCEEIIRNLRELKNKKQKWQAPTYSNPPIRQEPQKQKSTNQYQYYPKINYFSSSGSPYNKSTSLGPSFKNIRLKSTRINTLEDMKPKESNNTKNIKNKKNTEKNMQQQNQLKNNEKDEESQSPLGIRQHIKLPKKSSKVRHKVFKTVVLKKQAEQNEQSMQESKAQQKQQNQNIINIQNLKKHQLELTACVVELTKCLKKLNQQNKQKQQEESQEKTKYQKEQTLQQNEQRQRQRQQRYQKKQSQLQSSRAKSQQKYIQVQSPPNEDENDLEPDLDSLKYKVILALKKVNNKSHDFVVKMSGHSRLTIQHDESYQKIPSRQQKNSKSKEKTKDRGRQKQKQTQKSRIKKQQKQKQYQLSRQKQKQRQYQQSRQLQKQKIKQEQQGQRQKQRSAQKKRQKQKEKERQKQKKNVQASQLLKLLSSHLNQHEDQNQELSKCLRELHQYLKNQNEEIKQLKSFRDTQIMNQSKINSPQKEDAQNPHQNSPQINVKPAQPVKKYMSEQQKRKNQLKLQQAILKNLKKARMRGNVFKEKVQNYRKQHGMNSLQPNKQDTNQKQLQNPNPQPNRQPSKQPLKEQPAKQQKPIEQKPLQNKPQQAKPQQKGVIQEIKDKASNQIPNNQPAKV